MIREGVRDSSLPSAAPGRSRSDKVAGVFDGIQSFGLLLLLFGLPVGEALKSFGFAIAVAGFLGKLACGRRPAFGRRASLPALAVYFAVAILSVVFARPEFRRPPELLACAMTLVVFPLVLDACARRSRTVLFVWAIVVGAAVAALMGYAGYAAADVRHRLALPSIENAVSAGEYLAAAAVVGVGLLWFEWKAPFAGPILWISTVVSAVAVLLTKSRGPFIGAVAGLATVAAACLRRRYVVLLLVVAAVATWGFVATHPDARIVSARYQIDARLLAWRGAAERLAERPVLGQGLGSFKLFDIVYRDEKVEELQMHGHNVWLHAAAETGVLGAGALAVFLVLGMRDVVRAARSARRRLWRSVAVAALGGAAVLVVAGLFSVTVNGESGMLLFALLAIGAATAQEESAE